MLGTILLILGMGSADLVYGQAGDELPVAEVFSPPLGSADGELYAPRIEYVGDVLIESTDYGVKNPDLMGTTCAGS